MPHSLPAARSSRPPLVAWPFVSVLGAPMLARANKVLYGAKDGGRNTFRMAAA
jgi:hypothetical protein